MMRKTLDLPEQLIEEAMKEFKYSNVEREEVLHQDRV
jgi:hypothetical protein